MIIELNKDKKVVKSIKEAIKQNDGYCPCSIEKTEDTKCMCKAFRELKAGECACGLYIKKQQRSNKT